MSVKELNKALAARLRAVLSAEAYEELKALGSAFQKGRVGVGEYYDRLSRLTDDRSLVTMMIDAMPQSQTERRDALRLLHCADEAADKAAQGILQLSLTASGTDRSRPTAQLGTSDKGAGSTGGGMPRLLTAKWRKRTGDTHAVHLQQLRKVN